jgi:uncharacterized protein YjgD (DUF1641 family)
MDNELAQINQKLDFLTQQLESQRQRQDEINELVHDAVPLVNHMIKLSIDELAEIGSDFQLEDLTFLFKRVLRDTRLLVSFLDQVESIAELAEEGQVMGKRIFHQVTMELDHLEREGYFDMVRAGIEVAEKLANQFTGDDIRKFGDDLLETMHEEIPQNPTFLSLFKQMNDPKVKRGLYRSLNVLKTIGN